MLFRLFNFSSHLFIFSAPTQLLGGKSFIQILLSYYRPIVTTLNSPSVNFLTPFVNRSTDKWFQLFDLPSFQPSTDSGNPSFAMDCLRVPSLLVFKSNKLFSCYSDEANFLFLYEQCAAFSRYMIRSDIDEVPAPC